MSILEAPREPRAPRRQSSSRLLPAGHLLVVALLLAAGLPGAAPAADPPPADTLPEPGDVSRPPAGSTAGSTAGSSADSSAAHVTGDRLRQILVGGVPVLLLDDIRIVQEGATLTARVGRYDRERRRAVVEEDVVLIDGATRITGDHGTYDVESRLATMAGDVVIERESTTIRGPRATYERATAVARIGGGVEVIDRVEGRHIQADSLVYWADEDRAEAYGSVRIDDERGDTVIRGQVANFDRSGEGLRVSRQASMVLEDRARPIIVSAEDLLFHEDSGTIEATGGVRVQQGLTETTSRAAVFDRQREVAVLTGRPLALDPSGKVRGDTLELRFSDGELTRLTAIGDARSIYRRPAVDERASEAMRLEGDRLVVRVRQSSAEEVRVEGNARTSYVPGGDDWVNGARGNDARGERVRVLFRDGQPLRAIVEGDASGTYVYVDERRTAADTVAVAIETPAAAIDTLAVIAEAAPADTLAVIAEAAPADTLAATGPVRRAHDPEFELPSAPEPDSLLDRIRYTASTITFLAEKSEILLQEEATVDYRDMHLEAARVRFSAPSRELVATGDPVLEDRANKVTGDLMTYDLDRRQGTIVHGKTEFERGFYSGNLLRKASDGTFRVNGACYTTCDLDSPHFHFAGRQMKIYLDDKVVTRPLGLFIGRVPVLALPFYVFPIRKGRHSGLLMPRIEFGVSETRGRFVHNAGYYWVLNDYVDLELSADISERSPFFIGNSELRYAQRYRLNGDLRSSLTFGEGQRRWDVQGQHYQTLGEGRTLRANANFLSDRNFRTDAQGQFVDNRLETQLRSNVELRQSWSTQSLNVRFDRTQNLQNELGETEEGQGRVTGTLPSVSYNFNTRPIGRPPDAKGRGGRWPLLASTAYSFGLTYANGYDTRRLPDRFLSTVGGSGSLTDRRALGPLKVGPSARISTQYVERTETTDADGNLVPDIRHVLTGSWSTSMDASTDIFGTLSPTIGPFHGFRHTVTPRASISYSDRFDSRRDVEAGQPSSSLALSLFNRLETRIPDGEALRTLGDFLTFDLSTSYDLSNRSDRRFGDIRGSARLRPGFGSNFEMRYNATYDPYERRTVSYSTSSSFAFERRKERASADRDADERRRDGEAVGDQADPAAGERGREAGAERSGAARGADARAAAVVFPHAFRVSGTTTFSGGGSGQRTLQTSLGTAFSLTPNWRISHELRYDLLDLEVISQSYTIQRDLHCWEAQFRRTFSGRRWEYYFRIAIRDLPQIYYEKGTSQFNVPSFFGN